MADVNIQGFNAQHIFWKKELLLFSLVFLRTQPCWLIYKFRLHLCLVGVAFVFLLIGSFAQYQLTIIGLQCWKKTRLHCEMHLHFIPWIVDRCLNQAKNVQICLPTGHMTMSERLNNIFKPFYIISCNCFWVLKKFFSTCTFFCIELVLTAALKWFEMLLKDFSLLSVYFKYAQLVWQRNSKHVVQIQSKMTFWKCIWRLACSHKAT